MSKFNARNGKLKRSATDKWLAGVCGGIANYFGWSANILRALVIIAVIFLSKVWYIFVIAYLIGCFILPEE